MEDKTTDSEYSSWSKNISPSSLPLEDYALDHGLTKEQVMTKIHQGELSCRRTGGTTWVYSNPTIDDDSDVRPGASINPDSLPSPDGRLSTSGPSTHRMTPSTSTEVALLIDHLSIAKEENRDILQMSKSSIDQISTMSRDLLAAKDQLLEVKSQQNELLATQIESMRQEIKDLKQQNEDLQMLVKEVTALP